MESKCSNCDHDPGAVRASLRRDLATCEECGGTFCIACLADMAVKSGLIAECDKPVYTRDNNASQLLWSCEESNADLCPDCFERIPEGVPESQ